MTPSHSFHKVAEETMKRDHFNWTIHVIIISAETVDLVEETLHDLAQDLKIKGKCVLLSSCWTSKQREGRAASKIDKYHHTSLAQLAHLCSFAHTHERVWMHAVELISCLCWMRMRNRELLMHESQQFQRLKQWCHCLKGVMRWGSVHTLMFMVKSCHVLLLMDWILGVISLPHLKTLLVEVGNGVLMLRIWWKHLLLLDMIVGTVSKLKCSGNSFRAQAPDKKHGGVITSIGTDHQPVSIPQQSTGQHSSSDTAHTLQFKSKHSDDENVWSELSKKAMIGMFFKTGMMMRYFKVVRILETGNSWDPPFLLQVAFHLDLHL